MKKVLLTYGRWIVIFVVLSLPLILPFFRSGYFPTHDGEWAVVRLADMYREVKDGQFPPRFSGNLNAGYGYPLFQFAYPLPYYLGLPLFLGHLGLVNSIKLLFLLSVPLSGLAMFFASRKFWQSDASGVVSGVLYMYLPYRMVDLYARGSLGESLASVFFPLILYLMKSLDEKKSFAKIGFLGLAFGGLILTHNLMAVLFSIVIGVYLLFLAYKRTKQLKAIISGLVLGAGVSLYFWLPALIEKKYIVLSQIPIADRDLYYATLNQLLFSPFGYGIPPARDQFSYQIGLPLVIVIILSLISIILLKRAKKSISQEFVLLLGLSVFFILMMFSFAKPLWEHLPLLREINYPWTSLLPLGFLLSLVAGYIYTHTIRTKILILVTVILSIVMVIPIAHPSTYVNRGEGFYFTNDATTTSSKEYMPLWVKEIPTVRPENKVEIINGKGKVEVVSIFSHKIEFIADMDTEGIVRLNTIYFPGWKWYENGQEIAITHDNSKGVMEGVLRPGRHTIQAVFTETPLRLVSDVVSLVSAGTIILLLGISLRSKRVQKIAKK